MEFQELCGRLSVDYAATLARFSGNEGLFRRFLLRFPSDGTFAKLQAAQAAGDLTGMETGAHTLKGVSANLGPSRLQTACDQLVQAIRRGDEAAVPGLYAQVEQAYRAAVELLQSEEVR